MFYYLAKILQAAGLTIVLVAFIARFPELMSHNTLMVGLLIFAMGWIMQKFLIKQ